TMSTASATKIWPLMPATDTLRVNWTTSAAPNTEPQTVFLPPSSGIKITRKTTSSVHVSGVTDPTEVVNNAPPILAIAAPNANAAVLRSLVRIPDASIGKG